MAKHHSDEHELPEHSNDQHHEQPSIISKFKSFSPAKQFGLITLAALGTTMFLTGRTVRAIMRRIPKDDSHNGIGSKTNLTSDPKSLNKTNIEQPSETFKSSSGSLNSEQNPSELITDKASQEFNPGLDAIKALGIATAIVIGSATMAIKHLSNKWELDDWNDWKVFIQSGYLKRAILPTKIIIFNSTFIIFNTTFVEIYHRQFIQLPSNTLFCVLILILNFNSLNINSP